MEELIIDLLMQELKSSQSYFSRLLQVLGDKVQVNEQINDHYEKLVQNTYQNIFNCSTEIPNDLNINDWEIIIDNCVGILTKTLSNKLNVDKFQECSFDFINELYLLCHNIHNGFDPLNRYKIQMPRVFASTYCKEQHKEIPLFYLEWKNLLSFNDEGGVVYSLKLKSKEILKKLIVKANKKILDKKYKEAIDLLNKALRIERTGQLYCLMGWCYSFIGNLCEAKKMCHKAIEIEPDFGDAYNDIGSYILLEGRPLEALTWFEKAKKTKFINNREYPYINSGKAYMAIHNYQKALNEFEIAITYVPYHEELKSTLNNLREKIKEIPKQKLSPVETLTPLTLIHSQDDNTITTE